MINGAQTVVKAKQNDSRSSQNPLGAFIWWRVAFDDVTTELSLANIKIAHKEELNVLTVRKLIFWQDRISTISWHACLPRQVGDLKLIWSNYWNETAIWLCTVTQTQWLRIYRKRKSSLRNLKAESFTLVYKHRESSRWNRPKNHNIIFSQGGCVLQIITMKFLEGTKQLAGFRRIYSFMPSQHRCQCALFLGQSNL